MNEYLPDLIRKYKSSGILIDTNLLLLFFIGSFNPKLITEFKRTKQFTVDDFILLQTFLEPFVSIVTTTHVLTEVNSFSNQLPNHLKPAYYTEVATQLTTLVEIPFPSASISENVAFLKYGLTDIGILLVAEGKYLVLTDDFDLSALLITSGVDAINFNHLRQWFNE
jgi:hypothetical protein